MEAMNVFQFKKLNNDNYRQWKLDIKMLLMERGLFKFIGKSEPVLAEGATSREKMEFEHQKCKALATIYLSLEESQKDLVAEAETAKEAWTLLEEIYEPKSRARIAQLRSEFYSIKKQPSESIGIYLAHIQQAAKALKNAGKSIPEDEVAYQMIENLPPEFDNIVQQIYQLNDDEFLPDKVRTILLAEEGRILSKQAKEIDNSKVLVTEEKKNIGTLKKKKAKDCSYCKKFGHLASECLLKSTKNHSLKDKTPLPYSSKMSAIYASALYADSDETEWTIDTAATDHFCNKKELFQDYKELKNKSAALGEGNTVICGIGNVVLEIKRNSGKSRLTLLNVLHAPQMRRNLISGRLIDKAGLTAVIKNKKIQVNYPSGDEMFIAYLKNNFYVLQAKALKSSSSNLEQIDKVPESHNTSKTGNIELWHSRFGHQNAQDLIKMSKHKSVIGLENLKGSLECCDICKVSKLTKKPSKELPERTTSQPLELIHMDVWGPSPIKSKSGISYFLSIIDDYTRKVHVYVMYNKKNVFKYFLQFKAMAERQLNRKIKRIRTDNGMEFISKEFTENLKSSGIKVERTNIYCPEMNGVAERYNRTALEGVRSLLNEGKLPANMWAEALLAFTYLKNRFIHRKTNKTPLELWCGKKPSIRHIKRYGCLAFAYVPKAHRNKLQNRSRPGVFIGYALKTVGYRIWYPDEDKVEETKHVFFNESKIGMDSFPNKNDSTSTVTFMPEQVEEYLTIEEKEPPIQESTSSIEWKRVTKKREKGKTAGRVDVYYYPKPGVRLRSLKEVKNYCDNENINFDPKEFDFSTKRELKNLTDEDLSEESSEEEHSAMVTEIPKSYREAIVSSLKEKWINAMETEISILKDREVWEIVPRPRNKTVIGCRWVYSIKENAEGQILRYKAHLVAQGFHQVEGLDYHETFSPVVNFTLVRMFFFILLVIRENWIHNLSRGSPFLLEND
ncbi:Retrovirus-related Pol polyprotein from transposon TNT 1-94 [Araneus ventricosus]|uniref:Retrovirus-related Pol polyprotein from transposon TNT 1-94 n=1 Tax=Araneus ventricosus TaxID=182803 RepID=A0A4Y2RBP8_ARAVE|nr:Retrovirus-related Pol polyprotein from transposon TNT 1-94 [Araneus ventricosus]GBN73197.1 Retrovirus-related Pol polyprotein from transposon TNT 1-94 [Araneus ventricosus]